MLEGKLVSKLGGRATGLEGIALLSQHGNCIYASGRFGDNVVGKDKEGETLKQDWMQFVGLFDWLDEEMRHAEQTEFTGSQSKEMEATCDKHTILYNAEKARSYHATGFNVAGLKFTVWKTSARSIYAIASHKSFGLIISNLPNAILLILYGKPIFAQVSLFFVLVFVSPLNKF